ncbi:MAG: hypothetical protein L6437_05940 [Kiritimatiellae bacterium]|nr:hypothetical protein [Kiritimatiellia bacterium]
MMDRFLKEGGGVFLHYNSPWGGTAPNHLLKAWGIQFPLIYLKDPNRTQTMSKMSYITLAWTDQIIPGPVSDGVRQIWYPVYPAYFGQQTMPILVNEEWKPVVKPSKSAYTEVPRYDKGETQPCKGALIPAEPIKDPVLFAIRDFQGAGRMAAVQTWYQFSIGSGMKWLFNDDVLSRGLGGQSSDYGKLLLNTYKWLAEPSIKTGKVGGHVTDIVRLTEPQLRPDAIKQFAEWVYNEEEVLEYRRPSQAGRLFRGLIGAETQLGGGKGSVADYAKAAGEMKLDFIVFLDDIARLSPEKLDLLKTECSKHSSSNLQLYAGYKMDANIGNHMFIFGMNPPWPLPVLLTGPNKKTFNLQYQDEKGKFAPGVPCLDWLVYEVGVRNNNTVGYYDFSHSDNGMGMYNLSIYSMAALRTYQDGKLIDDALDDYLTTCQSTAVPTPVSLNIIRSPDEMRQAVNNRQALTYAHARSLTSLFQDALRWNHSNDGMNVFPSDGPLIKAWPKMARIMTFGAEPFVTGLSLNMAPIHITSDVGLKEIRIYNGQELFHRFLLNGEKEFNTTLLLSGVVQRSMVLVAEDIKGGRAISFAHRSYKEGTICPIFCSDHINDCGLNLLSHFPQWPVLFLTPVVPNCGFTWDGGPKAAKPFMSSQFTYPALFTKQGKQENRFRQIPLLEFSDEGANRCRVTATKIFPDEIPNLTFGPCVSAPLFDTWAALTLYDQYLTGVVPNAYGAPGVGVGTIAGLYTEKFFFKKDLTIQDMRFFHSDFRAKSSDRSVLLAVGKGSSIDRVIDLSRLPDQPKNIKLSTGSWFGLFSSYPGNALLFINRKSPLTIQLRFPPNYWFQLWSDFVNKPVKAGESCEIELFFISWPMDMMISDARELADTVAYLENPEGMQIKRGNHEKGPGGLLELSPSDFAVELAIPKPKDGRNITVPLRISPFNKRWTVGLYQLEGYRTHYYSKGNSGWCELGLDLDGRAYIPLFSGMASNTHVLIGHPVVADDAGKELFIQVTRITEGDDKNPSLWHVSVNNPLDTLVTTTLRQVMDLPGLNFNEQKIVLQPGEYKILIESKPSVTTKK